MKRIFAVVVLLALAVPAFAAIEGSFQRSFNVNGPVTLEVNTRSGNISVRTGGAGSVQVSARIRASQNSWFISGASERSIRDLEKNPPISQSGNSIRIDNPQNLRNVSISYEITVPAQTTLRARSGSGDVTIDGINGEADANTGSGNITLRQLGARARLQTGSGDIRLEGTRGPVNADTGSGNVSLKGVEGAVVARTGSGDVSVDGNVSNVNATTGSGNVAVSGARGGLEVSTGSGDIHVNGEPRGIWRVSAGSGNVDLNLPANAAFQADFRTSSGTVRTNHPVTVQGTANKRHLVGSVRGGGQLVKVDTGSGDISVN